MYQTGDTVRLKATFSSFENVLVNLSNPPTLRVYNSDKEIIDEIDGTLLTHPSNGVYFYDYTLPITEGMYVYEFSGTQDATIILRRGHLDVGFL